MKLKHIILFSTAMVIFTGCGNKKTDVQQERERVEKVRTTVVANQVVARQIELSSILEGYETMNVSPSGT